MDSALSGAQAGGVHVDAGHGGRDLVGVPVVQHGPRDGDDSGVVGGPATAEKGDVMRSCRVCQMAVEDGQSWTLCARCTRVFAGKVAQATEAAQVRVVRVGEPEMLLVVTGLLARVGGHIYN